MSNQVTTEKNTKAVLLPKGILLPFILLSSCFMWWGIANNITDPLVRVFKAVFGDLSTFEASLIQFAFYGGYFCMAIPGAIIARKFSYKCGVLVGLGFYAIGCLSLYPATLAQEFSFFCISYYVLACGLGILETNANPYILALGPEKTATMRLNLAQAFNPIGSVIGIMLCREMIMAKLPQVDGNIVIPSGQEAEALNTVILPYLIVAGCLVIVWILIALVKMPRISEDVGDSKDLGFFASIAGELKAFGTLFGSFNYSFAVVAQFFYVGAQITVWTYTNFYIPEEIGATPVETLEYHTWALVLFCLSRWVFTGLMKKIRASTLLLFASIAAAVLSLVVVFVGGIQGVYALIGISVFMSLMFPTIFGLGCQGLGKKTKIGASGLVMAILGGALITPLQGAMIDWWGVGLSYLLPLVCFIVIGAYSIVGGKVEKSLS